MNHPIGLKCGLEDGQLQDMLCWFAEKDYDVLVYDIYKIDNKSSIMPISYKNISIHSSGLKEFFHSTIWEMVMYIYPPGAEKQAIDTYEDYVNSQCVGCVIYYDCGYLEVYTKDVPLLHEIDALASAWNVEEKSLITESNRRTIMHL